MKQEIISFARAAITSIAVRSVNITFPRIEGEVPTIVMMIDVLDADGITIETRNDYLTQEQYDSWGTDDAVLAKFATVNLGFEEKPDVK